MLEEPPPEPKPLRPTELAIGFAKGLLKKIYFDGWDQIKGYGLLMRRHWLFFALFALIVALITTKTAGKFYSKTIAKMGASQSISLAGIQEIKRGAERVRNEDRRSFDKELQKRQDENSTLRQERDVARKKYEDYEQFDRLRKSMPGKNAEEQLAALFNIMTNAVAAQTRVESSIAQQGSNIERMMEKLGIVEKRNRRAFSNEFTMGYTLITFLGPTTVVPYSGLFTNSFTLDWGPARLTGGRLISPTITTRYGGVYSGNFIPVPPFNAEARVFLDSRSSMVFMGNSGMGPIMDGDTLMVLRWVLDDQFGPVLLLGFKPNK